MCICPVILAGGSGKRLWPLSNSNRPKQFLSLYEEDTLLQITLKRASKISSQPPVIICNQEHRFLVAEQIRGICESAKIILEPIGRNTAPAITLTSLVIENDPILLVLSSDHVIQNEEAFFNALEKALPLVKDGKLVTFGVIPNEPNIGYGYIKKGTKIGEGFQVDKFIEKPSIEKAEEFVKSDHFYWNSGIFLFQSSRYINELKKFRPKIFDNCVSAVNDSYADKDFYRVNAEKFKLCPSESIDYAVMENTDDAVVLPVDMGWCDIGSWSSLWEICDKDDYGNVINGNVILYDTHNSFVHSEGKLLSAIGVDNLAIIATEEAILIANKSSAQGIKKITDKILDKSPQKKIHKNE
jgi:mannose-1-phosphate guanylyltransferase